MNMRKYSFLPFRSPLILLKTSSILCVFILSACSGGSDKAPADTKAPDITLIGEKAILHKAGTDYYDSGASATDNIDGSVDVKVTGSVDDKTVGKYTLTYTAVDIAGNTQTTIRIVEVVNVGNFVGPIVSGIHYKTESYQGVTDEFGAFNYKEGESITFSLGGSLLGDTIIAKEELALSELIPEAILYTSNAQVSALLTDALKSDRTNTLYKLHNLLTFLYTLDEDAEPTNGITIHADVAERLESTSIEFSNDLFTFYKNKNLRLAIQSLFNFSYLSSGKILSPGRALDYYYTNQNMSNKFGVYELSRKLPENDFFELEQANSYDDKGNLLTTTYYNENKEVSSIRSYTYDAQGNKLSSNSSNSDKLYTFTYDSDSNLLTEELVEVFDGKVNSKKFTFTYDDAGNKLTRASIDNDVLTGFESYISDISGNILRLDSLYVGFSPRYVIKTFDENHKWLTSHEYRDEELLTDPVTTLFRNYDEYGNLINYKQDYIAGDIEYTLTYTYDGKGNKLSEYKYTDVPYYIGRGYFYTFTYDNYDNLSEEYVDREIDGVNDNVIKHSYDAKGNKISKLSEGYGIDYGEYGELDAKFSTLEESIYNEEDNLTSVAKNSFTTLYDDDGSEISVTLTEEYDVIKYSWASGTWQELLKELAP